MNQVIKVFLVTSVCRISQPLCFFFFGELNLGMCVDSNSAVCIRNYWKCCTVHVPLQHRVFVFATYSVLVFIKFGYSVNCSIVFTQASSLLQWSRALHLMFHMLMALLSRRLRFILYVIKVWRSPLFAMTCTNFKEVQDECGVWNLGNGLEALLAVVCQLCMYTVSIYLIP